uniref:Cell cycle associated protein 1 n=1 Tax=Scleropages formosus TaxID=113540 RepID=A0A8C9WET6_SCLFO
EPTRRKRGGGGNNCSQTSTSPDVGAGPGSMTIQSSGAQTEAMKQVLGVIEKKVRNMEKKKSKLDDYQAKKNKGERLNQDQLEALSKFQEVLNNLEFARELQKSLLALGVDIQKAVKKAARREQLQREEAEQKRLKSLLEVQFVLDRLTEESVRQDIKENAGGSPLLTDTELTNLDNFCKLVGPERNQNIRLTDQYEEASVHLWELLEGRDKEVVGTTYKALKENLDKVLSSGYFDRAPSHHNGVCEEVEQEAPALGVKAETEEQSPEAGNFHVSVAFLQFVNQQFISEAAYSGSAKEHGDEWNTESEAANAVPQQLPTQATLPTTVSEPHVLTQAAPSLPVDPIVRKQAVQDLMAQMQGPYNFMQDSMLEFDGQALDPAIVSAQPMKPVQNMDLPHLVCPPVHTESRLTQANTVPVQPETTQVPMFSTSEAYSTAQPLYQAPPATEPRPQADPINPIQVSTTVWCLYWVFQPVSKPRHGGGINVNAAPFQSMQTVFNMNAPVPPGNEGEPLKQPSQFQSSYNQGFGSQTPRTADQSELQQEQLQSVVGAFHTQDPTVPTAGHQPISQQPSQQGVGFSRPAQSFYTTRAVSRGGPRSSRGSLNGYRGPSSGFRGGYDGYRPPFPNTPNSGYGQGQFNTPRDYSNSSYQREGYQQSYKRGTGQGARGSSRGNAQVMRS